MKTAITRITAVVLLLALLAIAAMGVNEDSKKLFLNNQSDATNPSKTRGHRIPTLDNRLADIRNHSFSPLRRHSANVAHSEHRARASFRSQSDTPGVSDKSAVGKRRYGHLQGIKTGKFHLSHKTFGVRSRLHSHQSQTNSQANSLR
jgi:hypothetical protein